MKRYSLQKGSDPPREDPQGEWVKMEDVAEIHLKTFSCIDRIYELLEKMRNEHLAIVNLLGLKKKEDHH